MCREKGTEQKRVEENNSQPPASLASVLVLAPRGQDASLAASALRRAELPVEICSDLLQVAQRFNDQTNVLLIAEEALLPTQLPMLLERLREQPAWSDVPVIILTAPGGGDRASVQALRVFGPAANVSLLERPLRIVTLVAALKTASRARRRQWEVRDLLIARENALASLVQAKGDADRANRAKDHFLAMLSHELRTPLTPVLMTVSVLQNDPSIPEHLRADVETLRRNVELEARLIDDLLDLTRISHGKLRLDTSEVNVHASLERALAVSAGDLEQKRLVVRKDFAAVRHYTRGDAARLEQVFWNIIKNAVKFTPEGGELLIKTTNSTARDRIRIDFTDTGIGIEPEMQAHIFDAFKQGIPHENGNHGGLGLGLAICQRLVDLHGGEISVQSEGKNRGATFRIELAALDKSEAVSPAPSLPRVRSSTPADILLVEDHFDTAHIMQRMLTSAGYRVSHASTATRARELAANNRFQLIISDLGLPDGNGLDLMRELRVSQNAKGIAVSGYGMETDVALARQAGFTEHLTKPIDWNRLRDAVERLLAFEN